MLRTVKKPERERNHSKKPTTARKYHDWLDSHPNLSFPLSYVGHMLFDLTCNPLKLPSFYVPISDDRKRVDILHPILQTSLVLINFSNDAVEVSICDPGLRKTLSVCV